MDLKQLRCALRPFLRFCVNRARQRLQRAARPFPPQVARLVRDLTSEASDLHTVEVPAESHGSATHLRESIEVL